MRTPATAPDEVTTQVEQDAVTESSRATEPIRVLVADDHGLYRRGLQAVLSLEDDIEIVGEAGDGTEAVERAEELLPDVVLMDIRMPRVTGIDACSAIKRLVPSTRIIILTASDDEDDLYAAVLAGADGYLLKDVPGEEIADGLRAVYSGQSLISPSMASTLLSEFALLVKKQPVAQALPPPRLTAREIQVLKLVARGMTNREIGNALFITENTVKNHVRNILDKLQMHSRMQAAMYAVKSELFELPD